MVSSESPHWITNQWIGLLLTIPQTSHLNSRIVVISSDLSRTFQHGYSGVRPMARVISSRENIAVVPQNWKIGAPGDFLGVLFLLDRVLGDAHNVVVLQRELHCFLQCDVASDSTISWRGSVYSACC